MAKPSSPVRSLGRVDKLRERAAQLAGLLDGDIYVGVVGEWPTRSDGLNVTGAGDHPGGGGRCGSEVGSIAAVLGVDLIKTGERQAQLGLHGSVRKA